MPTTSLPAARRGGEKLGEDTGQRATCAVAAGSVVGAASGIAVVVAKEVVVAESADHVRRRHIG